jgi:hypothetical protein
MSRKTEVTAKNRSDRKSVPRWIPSGQPQKRFPFGETGRAKAPPALLPSPLQYFSFPAIRTGVLLVNFLSCSSVMAITRKGQGDGPFGSRPALLSGRRAPLRQGGCCAPARLRRTPAGFGPTLGSDGEGQGLRLLRPCRPERLHRAGGPSL